MCESANQSQSGVISCHCRMTDRVYGGASRLVARHNRETSQLTGNSHCDQHTEAISSTSASASAALMRSTRPPAASHNIRPQMVTHFGAPMSLGARPAECTGLMSPDIGSPRLLPSLSCKLPSRTSTPALDASPNPILIPNRQLTLTRQWCTAGSAPSGRCPWTRRRLP